MLAQFLDFFKFIGSFCSLEDCAVVSHDVCSFWSSTCDQAVSSSITPNISNGPNILFRRRWSRQRRRNAGPCLGTVLYEATVAKVASGFLRSKGVCVFWWRKDWFSAVCQALTEGAGRNRQHHSILGGDWRDLFTPKNHKVKIRPWNKEFW